MDGFSGLAILAIIALLSAAVVQAMLLSRYRRDLESRLDAAQAAIRALNARLDEATRPPTQFARMHMRQVAMDRFVRLRLAAPRRARLTAVNRFREPTH